MLYGAVIGAVIGVVVSLVYMAKRSNREKKFLQALEQAGAGAARGQLENMIPGRAEVPINQIIDQRERMAALAILDDSETLEREIAAHRGKLTAVAQVNAMALLGLCVRSADPSQLAQRLDALATHLETEGGRMLKLVKKKVRLLAQLAALLASEGALDEQLRRDVASLLGGETPLVKIVLFVAMARATEAAGGNAGNLWAKVRDRTSAFDR